MFEMPSWKIQRGVRGNECARVPRLQNGNVQQRRRPICVQRVPLWTVHGGSWIRILPRLCGGIFLQFLEQLRVRTLSYSEYSKNRGDVRANKCTANNKKTLTKQQQQGTYGTDGNLTSVEQCIPCGIGEFGDKTGATKCMLCEMGSFSNETGSTACTKCPTGTYGEERGSVDIASGCKPCPPGRHAPKPGTFLSLELDATLSAAEQAEAQLPCTRCSTGTYAEEPGTVECTSCRAGTHNNRTGSFRRRDCVECARGNFTHEPGMTNCLLCPPGSFTNYTGMSECTLSPPGTQIPMFGAWNYSLAEDCELGYYAPNPGSGFCLKCEPGFYADEEGLVECKPCERGYFLNATNGTSPFDCMPW